MLIALGHECAGLMTDGRRARLANSSRRAKPPASGVWRLPLWDEYRENLQSEWADMKNTGGRSAGTINAGIFLKEFVPKDVPWAHLDVAGVAHFEKEQSGWPPGRLRLRRGPDDGVPPEAIRRVALGARPFDSPGTPLLRWRAPCP